jgi:hypothetical protein
MVKAEIKAWGTAHRAHLMVALLLILAAEGALGVWMYSEKVKWEQTHRLTPGWTYGPGSKIQLLYTSGDSLHTPGPTPAVGEASTCTNDLQEDFYYHSYQREILRRQEATALEYNLTPAEASGVVVWMGDWRGGPPVSWVPGFVPGEPYCIPANQYHPEEYRIGG